MKLSERLRERWQVAEWTREGDRVVVALSGGVDSTVLLHLLRFPLRELGLQVEAAHFDHRMRPESQHDARWVRGLCAAWEVPLSLGVSDEVLTSEGEARAARYAFLGRVREAVDARWILTAHHADDQIETILFRMARGTGLEGLAGIPETRAPGVLRPLLSLSRDEVMAYARANGLGYRHDPTNQALGPARNRIRHRVLPELERVHPGAREGILRLGRNAARLAEALNVLLDPVERQMGASEEKRGRWELDRMPWRSLTPEVQELLLHRWVRAVGGTLSESGTAVALEFMRTGSSGNAVALAGGIRLGRDFDRLWIEGRELSGAGSGEVHRPETLTIPGVEEGTGAWGAGIPSHPGLQLRWGFGPQGGVEERFDPAGLVFPLYLRGWQPGDRIRTTGGTRKVKEVLRECRIPRREREHVPVLTDGTGAVLWIPGRLRSQDALPSDRMNSWHVGVANERVG